MRVVLAPDSFKGTMTSLQAARAMEEGIRAVDSDADIRLCPVADGGEGTGEALVFHCGGSKRRGRTLDALGRTIDAYWYELDDEKTAVIEVASCAGLPLLELEERNPLVTSTKGLGILINDALQQGFQTIMVGLGGSATNDGGTGMARALGFRFLDAEGVELEEGGEALTRLARIDATNVCTELEKTEIIGLVDVEAPLYGPHGATQVYARQKGASEADVRNLERAIRRLAEICARDLHMSGFDAPGAGAAGGTGFGVLVFLGGRLAPGIAEILERIGFKKRAQWADVIITGEGSIDAQTLQGKTVQGVVEEAQELGRDVFAVCGQVRDREEVQRLLPLDHIFSAGNPGSDPVARLRERMSQVWPEILEHLKQNLTTQCYT